MKRFVVLLLFFCCHYVNSFAQVLPYAKEVVKTLTSDDFKGRGYVEQGDKRAADYIRSQFKEFGLKAFNEDYYQTFTTPVNTFPNNITLKINGVSLEAGKDFLVEPGSKSLSGTFNALTISNGDLTVNIPENVRLLDDDQTMLVIEPLELSRFTPEQTDRIQYIHRYLKYGTDPWIPNTIFLTEDKLTWSGSTMQFPQASFTVLMDSISLPIESIEVELRSELVQKYQTQNVLGYIPGNRTDSVVVLMAHYDHFGLMGEAMFPGANDNASGVAMLLNLAKYFSENKPEYTTVFIAFGAEEIGLIGSKYFVQNSPFNLDKIKFLLNFDLAGTGDEGIQVVNGSVYKSEFERLGQINEDLDLLPEVKIRGSACNSDHCAFDQKDIPGFYIYTLGGIRAYHDIYDKYETLPFTEFEDYFKLITEFLNSF